MAKPCSPHEVVARVRALLRRAYPTAAPASQIEVLNSGGLTMWPAQRRAEWLGKTLKFTNTEYRLLEILLRNVGRAVSKADLSTELVGLPTCPTTRSLDMHLSRIRCKLGRLSNGLPLIKAVHYNGYQFLEE